MHEFEMIMIQLFLFHTQMNGCTDEWRDIKGIDALGDQYPLSVSPALSLWK